VGAAYGRISLETIRFGDISQKRYNKMMLMDYTKVDLTPNNKSLFAALSRDYIDLFLMLSNILHPEIFGKYMTQSFITDNLLNQIGGSFLFP
jgi:hypothetical protein